MSFCCICTKNAVNLSVLSEIADSGVDYITKLKTCVPQEIWKDHYLICNLCEAQLSAAYDFVQICLKNTLFRKKHFVKKEKDNFHCFECGKGFRLKNYLVKHISKAHVKDEKIEIDEDNFQLKTETEDELNTILKESFLENDLDLDLDYKSQSESQIEYKEENNIKKSKKKDRKPQTCDLCNLTFKTKTLWTAHFKINHKDLKPYCCDQCDAQYLNAYSLLIHKRKHTNEKPFVCTVCGKAFISSADLNHHVKTHENVRMYTCQICDRSYKTHSNLRTHRIQVHLDYEKWEHQCQICKKKFPIQGNLRKHMKRHEGIKEFQCNICPKTFCNKSELTTHLNTHTNERHFKCQLCCTGVHVKAYKNREGLRRHMKVVHDLGNWKPAKSEKKLLCPMCPKVFAFNNKLQRHIYSHTGQRPYACQYCPKTFVDTYGRKVHVKKDHREFIKMETMN